ncbi:hypothetical protein BDW66DRAFT_144354 [Aspergillus desertorum]
MLYKCTTKFEMESEDLALQEEYLLPQEIEAKHEEKDARLLQDTLEPISDDEEDHDGTQIQEPYSNKSNLEHGTGGKRRYRDSYLEVEAEEVFQSDNEENPPLPNIQQRVSGRIRKRPRYRDGEFIEY